jgi:hypothetical protein
MLTTPRTGRCVCDGVTRLVLRGTGVLQFRLLGPLEVHLNDRRVAVGVQNHGHRSPCCCCTRINCYRPSGS